MERSAKIQTYMLALQNGSIRGNVMEVLDFVYKNHGASILQMRVELNIAHQSLTPAVSNLLDLGLIREIGTERVNDSVYSRYEFVPDAEEQDTLAKVREFNKFRNWIKQGLKEYDHLMTNSLREALKEEVL
jgi:predicted DNA-binding transcriptional regulator